MTVADTQLIDLVTIAHRYFRGSFVLKMHSLQAHLHISIRHCRTTHCLVSQSICNIEASFRTLLRTPFLTYFLNDLLAIWLLKWTSSICSDLLQFLLHHGHLSALSHSSKRNFPSLTNVDWLQKWRGGIAFKEKTANCSALSRKIKPLEFLSSNTVRWEALFFSSNNAKKKLKRKKNSESSEQKDRRGGRKREKFIVCRIWIRLCHAV